MDRCNKHKNVKSKIDTGLKAKKVRQNLGHGGTNPTPSSPTKTSANSPSSRCTTARKGVRYSKRVYSNAPSVVEHCVHQSAHELAIENNKMKIFNGMLARLETIQTTVIQKVESMKRSMPGKIKRDYKFIGVVLNDECKLVVHDDCLKKLPKKLPAHAVADFKEQIQDLFKGSLSTFKEHVKNKQGPEFAHLVELLEQGQAHCLTEVFNKIDDLFSVTDPAEKIEKEYQNRMQEAKREMCELRKVHASQMTECELEIAENNVAIADLTRKIEELEKDQEMLQNTVQTTRSKQIMEQEESVRLEEQTEEVAKLLLELEQTKNLCSRAEEDHARLVEEINSLKENQTMLTRKLKETEIAHIEKIEEIAKLQKAMEQSKKQEEDTRFHSQEVINTSKESKKTLNMKLQQAFFAHKNTERELNLKTEENANLQKELEKRNQSLEHMRSKIQKERGRSEKEIHSLKEFQTRLIEKLQQTYIAHEEEIGKLQKELEQGKLRIEDMRSQTQENCSLVTEELKSLKGSQTSFVKELQQTDIAHNEKITEIAKLQKDLDKIQQLFGEMHSYKQEEINSLKDSQTPLTENVKQTYIAQNEKTEEIVKLQKELAKRQKLVLDMHLLKQDEYARLDEEIHNLKEIQKTLTEKLKQSDNAHKTALFELRLRTEENLKLKNRFDDMRSLAKTEVCRVLYERANDATKLKAIKEQMEKDYVALEEKLVAATQELEKIRARMGAQHNPEEMERNIENLRVQLMRCKSDNTQLREYIEKVQPLIDNRHEVVNLLEEKVTRLKRSVNEKRQRIKDLIAAINMKNKEISKLKINLDTKEHDFNTLFSTLETSQNDLTEARELNKLLEEGKEMTRLEINIMQQELDALKRATEPHCTEKKSRQRR